MARPLRLEIADGIYHMTGNEHRAPAASAAHSRTGSPPDTLSIISRPDPARFVVPGLAYGMTSTFTWSM